MHFAHRLQAVVPWTRRHALGKRVARLLFLAIVCIVFASVWLIIPRRPPPELPELPLQTFPEKADLGVAKRASEFDPVRLDVTTMQEACKSFPKHMLSRIQPVLKVGHGDNQEKLQAQMESVSACFSADELLVMSDFEERIGAHDGINVLAHLAESHYNATRFKLWGSYLNLQRGRGDVRGWDLDKFKFLPAVEVAWAKKPNREFYVFYETDTYIFWDNLFRFLDSLKPDENPYMGSPTPGRADPKRLGQGTFFANGGPGYVVSRGAMRAMLEQETDEHASFSSRWSHLQHDDECCGDSVLGWVLWQLGIPMHGHWPMFSPFHLAEIAFGDAHWCQPVMTMHRVSPEDMRSLFTWEFSHRNPKVRNYQVREKRNPGLIARQRPLIYADLWPFYKPGTVAAKENWNGASHDEYSTPRSDGATNFDECGAACVKDSKCMQWKWLGQDARRCILVSSLQHGQAASTVHH
ncbi:hypothetical protein MY10362_008407 [Beauveria mimosiformis]